MSAVSNPTEHEVAASATETQTVNMMIEETSSRRAESSSEAKVPISSSSSSSVPALTPEEERRIKSRQIQEALETCRGCNNKAKKDCIYQCCRACCKLLNKPCPGHPPDKTQQQLTESKTAMTTAAAATTTTGKETEEVEESVSVPVYQHRTDYPIFSPMSLTASSSTSSHDELDVFPFDPTTLIGKPFTGTVVAAFAEGYHIQVMVEGYILNGFILNEACVVQLSVLPATANNINVDIQHVSNGELLSFTPPVYETPPTAQHPLLLQSAALSRIPLFRSLSTNTGTRSRKRGPYAKTRERELLASAAEAAAANTNNGELGQKKKKKKKKKSNRPFDEPKGPRSAYVYFQATMRAKLATSPPEQHASIIQQFDWHRVSEADKEPYKQLAAKDKIRYEKEMAEWNKSKATKLAGLETPAANTTIQQQQQAMTLSSSSSSSSSSGSSQTLPVLAPQEQPSQSVSVSGQQHEYDEDDMEDDSSSSSDDDV